MICDAWENRFRLLSRKGYLSGKQEHRNCYGGVCVKRLASRRDALQFLQQQQSNQGWESSFGAVVTASSSRSGCEVSTFASSAGR